MLGWLPNPKRVHILLDRKCLLNRCQIYKTHTVSKNPICHQAILFGLSEDLITSPGFEPIVLPSVWTQKTINMGIVGEKRLYLASIILLQNNLCYPPNSPFNACPLLFTEFLGRSCK